MSDVGDTIREGRYAHIQWAVLKSHDRVLQVRPRRTDGEPGEWSTIGRVVFLDYDPAHGLKVFTEDEDGVIDERGVTGIRQNDYRFVYGGKTPLEAAGDPPF